MKKNRKLFVSLQIILYLSLAIVVSFAWIPRNWAPEINYHQISISTQGALVISFGGDDSQTSVDINQIVNKKNLTLKQVSSYDGAHFVSADFKPVISNGVPKYIKNEKNEGENYIETVFFLKSNSVNDATKAIFLHKDSFIGFPNGTPPENAAYRALRVSITLGDKADTKPFVFANTYNRGGYVYQAANPKNAVGQNIYEDYINDKTRLNENALETQNVHPFSDYDMDNGGEPLFYMQPNSSQKIIIRIWLEGCDKECISSIAGDEMDLTIKFDSKIIGGQNK